MRYLIALILWLLPALAGAQEWEDRQVFGDAPAPLRVLSSTDTSFFAPIIEGYLTANPGTAVEYLVTGTADLNTRFRADPAAFDLVISSAMDLQLKLANDGFGARIEELDHPDWAEWRQTLFAFTSEPAAIVINRAAFTGHDIPQTRQELIQSLRARPEVFRGRVGTYDVRQSGLGYLFATQDARASETYWRLMEVMGALDAKLYCCSGEMIDELADGRLAVAYNVLGSYAQARQAETPGLEIILPQDFPTTMMRSALISRDAPQPARAEAFLRHLLGPGIRAAPLPALTGELGQSTITLAPALMTYLDTLKRRTFLTEWENAIIQRQ
ncbi:iron(III) transport system substrate-binding protein [Litoreibacter ponti]|uniref:Iron(III) transport system substrate-binding protein n=1 Tax=Litoreibacter ponti TaxID=1510457 RepID=A0A2T6BJE7_9RHOB|nr:extracellular solute-binding protein [Litoreibacter ponti]PTX56175.1 iron(III) transport system substrate-binding protein [Litoreibacter ponti]